MKKILFSMGIIAISGILFVSSAYADGFYNGGASSGAGVTAPQGATGVVITNTVPLTGIRAQVAAQIQPILASLVIQLGNLSNQYAQDGAWMRTAASQLGAVGVSLQALSQGLNASNPDLVTATTVVANAGTVVRNINTQFIAMRSRHTTQIGVLSQLTDAFSKLVGLVMLLPR